MGQICLSIVTVAKNDTHRLLITLNSLNYSSNLVEHILVIPRNEELDPKVLEFTKNSNNSIRIVRDQGLGIYHAMNIGSNEAKGKFLVYWNAGEACLDQDTLEEFVARLDSEDLDWCIFGAKFAWGLRQNLNSLDIEKFIGQDSSHYISHQQIVFRSSRFGMIGGYDERYKIASDFDLICRFSQYPVRKYSDINLINVEFPNLSARWNRQARVETLRILLTSPSLNNRKSAVASFLVRELKEKFTSLII